MIRQPNTHATRIDWFVWTKNNVCWNSSCLITIYLFHFKKFCWLYTVKSEFFLFYFFTRIIIAQRKNHFRIESQEPIDIPTCSISFLTVIPRSFSTEICDFSPMSLFVDVDGRPKHDSLPTQLQHFLKAKMPLKNLCSFHSFIPISYNSPDWQFFPSAFASRYYNKSKFYLLNSLFPALTCFPYFKWVIR